MRHTLAVDCHRDTDIGDMGYPLISETLVDSRPQQVVAVVRDCYTFEENNTINTGKFNWKALF